MNEGTKERRNEGTKERTNERTNEQTNERTNERTNEGIEWGEKKILKINLYKLYRQVSSYADLLRAVPSLGKERVTNLLKTSTWKANEQDRSSLGASSPFGGVAKSHSRTTRKRRHEREGWATRSRGFSRLAGYGRNDKLINKLRSIHHLLFCRCTSELY